MEMELEGLHMGIGAAVTAVNTEAALKSRLESFGMVPGTWIVPRYRSSDGTVTALEFRGTVIALRTRDLRNIRVAL